MARSEPQQPLVLIVTVLYLFFQLKPRKLVVKATASPQDTRLIKQSKQPSEVGPFFFLWKVFTHFSKLKSKHWLQGVCRTDLRGKTLALCPSLSRAWAVLRQMNVCYRNKTGLSTHRLFPTSLVLSYLNLFMSLHFYKNEWLKVSIISQTRHPGSLEGINQRRSKQTAVRQ